MSEFDEMVKFLDFTYRLKDQLVPCLIGPIGIGKTAAVEQHAKNVNARRVVKIVASQILPNEVSGITMPVNETKSMEIFDHYRLSSLQDGDILFFDELLEADQMVLSACLTLIENREMMSGKKLPDIQIIAATNPTISPSNLKESIRNRFLFRQFKIDNEGARLFIKKDTGLDLGQLVRNIQSTGGDYNILSQRSLTKMARWIMTAESDLDAKMIADQINAVWKNLLGDELLAARAKLYEDPTDEIKRKMMEMVNDAIFSDRVEGFPESLGRKLNDGTYRIDEDAFMNTSIPELYEVLSNMNGWSDIALSLENISVDDLMNEKDGSAFSIM